MSIYQGFRYSDRKDHILIRAYCGDDIDVNVPATIKGKPVTEIAPFAFVPEADQKWIPHNDFLKRCTNRIRSIYLPETILRLDLAFSCCFDLEEVFLPRSIESIGTGCFNRCEKLRTIHVDDGNNLYCSKNGILYSKDGRSLFCCPAAHPLQTVNYLDGVEIIERMESVDMTAQNIEKIGALFPNCITETVDENGKPKKAINFELLKQMLSGDVIEGSEAYEFTWVGKKAAIVRASRREPRKTAKSPV